MTRKYMPVAGGPAIPWAMLEPHEAQARANHHQSLARLAERGGLDTLEALAILSDRSLSLFMAMTEEECRAKLVTLIDADQRVENDRLRVVLNDAAASLETLAIAGRRPSLIEDLGDVRAYAGSRARVVRTALEHTDE